MREKKNDEEGDKSLRIGANEWLVGGNSGGSIKICANQPNVTSVVIQDQTAISRRERENQRSMTNIKFDPI